MLRSATSHDVPAGGTPGFTLIEMIVVLVVISLALAVIIPNVGRSTGHYGLAATAHDVATALRLARDRAISTNQPIRFIAADGMFGAAEDKNLHHVPRGMVLTISDSDQPVSAKKIRQIEFFPDGSSRGGTVEVIDGTARYAVRVDWITGNVSIQPQRSGPRR
jgi:general secretion pathway protein H